MNKMITVTPTSKEALSHFDSFVISFLGHFDTRLDRPYDRPFAEKMFNHFRKNLLNESEEYRPILAGKTVTLFRQASRNPLLAKQLIMVLATDLGLQGRGLPFFMKSLSESLAAVSRPSGLDHQGQLRLMQGHRESLHEIATQTPSTSLVNKVARTYLRLFPYDPA